MKNKKENLFSRVKVEMVMRIYNVSRSKALAMIKGDAEKSQPVDEPAKPSRRSVKSRSRLDDTMEADVMTAEEFFGV